MCPRSELSYRFEPHDYIHLRTDAAAAVPVGAGMSGRVYPGWQLGGYQEGGIPGTTQLSQDWSITVIRGLIGSYGRLTGLLIYYSKI